MLGHTAIHAFLRGETTPDAVRIRTAVLNPGIDPEADLALTKFHTWHLAPQASPGVAEGIDESVAQAEADAVLARLVAWCQRRVATTPPVVSAAGGADTDVSSVISTHLGSTTSGRRKNLQDPLQLWPVLLEMTAIRMNEDLTPSLAADRRFAKHLRDSLREAFDKAENPQEQSILEATLSGEPLTQIARRTGEVDEDVEQTIRVLHSRIQEFLPR